MKNCLTLLYLLVFCPLLFSQDASPLTPAQVEKVGELPPLTKALNEKAAVAFSKGDWASARKGYKEMIEMDPKNALVWANLGAVEQQAGDAKAAVGELCPPGEFGDSLFVRPHHHAADIDQ